MLSMRSLIAAICSCLWLSAWKVHIVVDSVDVDRLSIAREELSNLLQAEEMKESLLLVLANKQDLAGALDIKSMAQQLNLNQMCSNPWYIQPCVATTGQGLYEGLDWLSSALQKSPPSR